MEDTSKAVSAEETVVETPETETQEPSETAEETQETEKPLLAGKYKSAEELEKAYKEAQRLISEQGNKLKGFEQPAIPKDQQQILDELKKLGVVTKSDLEFQTAKQAQAAKDNAEVQSLGLTESQESILRRYANNRDNLNKSMTECWDELQTITGKVVTRKTTIKPRTGNRSGFTEKSVTELSKLPKAEYDKYWADYAKAKAG